MLTTGDGRFGLSSDSLVSRILMSRHICSFLSFSIAGPIVGNTSYPILLIGNAADPVTPLAKSVFISFCQGHVS